MKSVARRPRRRRRRRRARGTRARVPPRASRGRRRRRARRRSGPPSGGCRARARARSAGNHPMTARPLAALTLAPSAPASTSTSDERAVRLRRAATASARRAARGRRDHPALVDAVGEQPPRQQRNSMPMRDPPSTMPVCAERQVVVRAQRGRERGQADRGRREARLRERPRGEDHPAVAAQFAASARSRISFALRISFASGPFLSGPATSSTAGRP